MLDAIHSIHTLGIGLSVDYCGTDFLSLSKLANLRMAVQPCPA